MSHSVCVVLKVVKPCVRCLFIVCGARRTLRWELISSRCIDWGFHWWNMAWCWLWFEIQLQFSMLKKSLFYLWSLWNVFLVLLWSLSFLDKLPKGCQRSQYMCLLPFYFSHLLLFHRASTFGFRFSQVWSLQEKETDEFRRNK